jgi:RNA polymerase sigma factor (sigma-70 family)
MTAVPNWDIVDPLDTDAELVRASLAGDRVAFGQMYDRYADRLHDFCVGMLRDRDGAADCVQDAFCIAATRLPQLRGPDKLRPWLYSIARNEALRRLRERRRETPSEELPDEMSHEPGPDTLAARSELADLIAEAAGGLSDRDQAVLELAYRHGLDGPELAEALGVSQTNANTMVVRLRATIERSLGALLVSRRVRNNPAGCSELAAVLEGWDGHFNVLTRKRVARHIESCPTCDEERRRHRRAAPCDLRPCPAPASDRRRHASRRRPGAAPRTCSNPTRCRVDPSRTPARARSTAGTQPAR